MDESRFAPLPRALKPALESAREPEHSRRAVSGNETADSEIHGEMAMNKNRVKGAIDEAVGTAKRKAGKLTGNTPLRAKGIAQQMKGKLGRKPHAR